MQFTTFHSLLAAILASQALAAPTPRAEAVVRDTDSDCTDGTSNTTLVVFLLLILWSFPHHKGPQPHPGAQSSSTQSHPLLPPTTQLLPLLPPPP